MKNSEVDKLDKAAASLDKWRSLCCPYEVISSPIIESSDLLLIEP